MLELAGAGLIHGPAHSSIGQEGGAVGSVLGLTSRGHGQRLAPRPPPVPRQGRSRTSTPKGIDPTEPLSRRRARGRCCARLAEICGLDRGFSHGRGGSHAPAVEGGRRDRHQRHRRRRRPAGRRLRLGAPARRHRRGRGHLLRRRRDQHRLHARDDEPRRGLEAAALLLHREQPVRRLHQRRRGDRRAAAVRAAARASASASWKVDGMDPLAVYLAMQEALAHMRAGHGPTVVEADVYRYFHQNGAFPGSAFGYRTKEEEAAWRQRDPIDQLRAHLARRGILDARPTSTRAIAAAKALMAEIGDVLLEPLPGGKPGQRRIKAARVARPGVRRRRRPRRPERVRRRAARRPRHVRRRARRARSSSTPSPR